MLLEGGGEGDGGEGENVQDYEGVQQLCFDPSMPYMESGGTDLTGAKGHLTRPKTPSKSRNMVLVHHCDKRQWAVNSVKCRVE